MDESIRNAFLVRKSSLSYLEIIPDFAYGKFWVTPAKPIGGLWPSVAPTGYLNSKNVQEKGKVFVDPDRAPVIKEIFTKVAYENWSGRMLYTWLRQIGFVTRTGKPLTLSNMFTILNNHFYYGRFEYPRGSGRWYQGAHTPLISKGIFDDVQKQLQGRRKVKSARHEFSFTRLMTCGLCGSGITAETKYKNLKSGEVAEYIFYGCTRARDKYCKGGYLEEKQLLAQLLELMDTIDLDRSGMRKKLEAEIERHKEFHSKIMGMSAAEYRAKDVDIRNYAKHVLRYGNLFEKRDLLACLKSSLKVIQKQVTIE